MWYFILTCQLPRGSAQCAAGCCNRRQHCHVTTISASQKHSHHCVPASQFSQVLLSSRPKQQVSPVTKGNVELIICVRQETHDNETLTNIFTWSIMKNTEQLQLQVFSFLHCITFQVTQYKQNYAVMCLGICSSGKYSETLILHFLFLGFM